MVALRTLALALLANVLTASQASTLSFLQLHRLDNDQSSVADASEEDVATKDNKLNDVAQDGSPEDLIRDPEELIHALTDQARTRAMGFREFADDVVKDISPQDSNVADDDVAERVHAAEEDVKDLGTIALAKTEDEVSEKTPVDPPVEKSPRAMTPRMQRTKEQFQDFAAMITGRPAPSESEPAAPAAPLESKTAAPAAPLESDTEAGSEPVGTQADSTDINDSTGRQAGTLASQTSTDSAGTLASQTQQPSEEIKDYTHELSSSSEASAQSPLDVAPSAPTASTDTVTLTSDEGNTQGGGSSVEDSSMQDVSSASVEKSEGGSIIEESEVRDHHEESEGGSIIEDDDAMTDVSEEGTSGDGME